MPKMSACFVKRLNLRLGHICQPPLAVKIDRATVRTCVKVPILLIAVLEVKPEIVLAAGETGYGDPYGKSWVTISVREIVQMYNETECAPNC